MADGRGDGGALSPLVPYLGGLAALVVGLAVVFWGVGQIRGGGAADEQPTVSAPTTPAATTPATSTPVGTPSPTDGATPTATPTGPATPTEPTATLAPADVSVQVLDATGGEGGAAEVAADLQDAGYEVVAENAAVTTYEQTTVFYTEDRQDAARQIADEFGYPVVEAKPDNLSSSVDVHVVVGQDRG